jgi:plastocyanin
MRRQALALLALVSVIALAAAGCGGGSDSSASATPPPTAASTTGSGGTTTGSGEATTLQLSADPSALAYDKTSLSAPAGTVTIVFTNPSATPHDVAIQGNGVDVTSDVVANGESTQVSAKLEPGTYTYLCTVDGHADEGMKGTLTVTG